MYYRFTLPFLCNSIIELLNEYSKEAFENGKGVLVKLLINWFHAHGLKMSSESFQEGTSRHNFLPQFTTSTFFLYQQYRTHVYPLGLSSCKYFWQDANFFFT